jgi:hypothetical protein
MFTINERERFPIVRKLNDPSDSGTYYVRAVVRNGLSGATISTVNLDNDGLGIQRFMGVLTAPADPSGQGFYIDIVTKVYSDAAYTTQDTVYTDEVNTYLVGQRYNHNLGNGGGAGPDVDYKKIRKIVQEVVAEGDKTEKINEKIDGIEIPEAPELDLSPVLSRLDDMRQALMPKEGNEKAHSMMGEHSKSISALQDNLLGSVGRLSEELDGIKEEIGKKFESASTERHDKTSSIRAEVKKFDEAAGKVADNTEKITKALETVAGALEKASFTISVDKVTPKKLEAAPKEVPTSGIDREAFINSLK